MQHGLRKFWMLVRSECIAEWGILCLCYQKLLGMYDENEMKELLGENGILLCPTHPSVAPFHSQSYFKPINVMYAAIFNVLGFPATTIPVGLSSEEAMPLSIQAVASPMCDRLTLSLANALERPFGGWVPPFKDDLDLYY